MGYIVLIEVTVKIWVSINNSNEMMVIVQTCVRKTCKILQNLVTVKETSEN